MAIIRIGPAESPGAIVVATVEEAVALRKCWLYNRLRAGAIPLERMAALDWERSVAPPYPI